MYLKEYVASLIGLYIKCTAVEKCPFVIQFLFTYVIVMGVSNLPGNPILWNPAMGMY